MAIRKENSERDREEKRESFKFDEIIVMLFEAQEWRACRVLEGKRRLFSFIFHDQSFFWGCFCGISVVVIDKRQ